MDSPQSVVSPFKHSSSHTKSKNGSIDLEEDLDKSAMEILIPGKETVNCEVENFLGVLEVFVHQARDIHNICIYQKQDVYAKLRLTSDPETTVSTKIINGGGRNPVFNENLRLNVRNFDSSIKCEIWMSSRVRNYLEDQLLGFALVPFSEVLLSGRVEKDLSLSSTDLFHSPAGFVQLLISYSGALPEVIPTPAPLTSVANELVVHDLESIKSLSGDLDKIEFPDPKVINENHRMVEEYFAIPLANLDLQSSDTVNSPDTENHASSEFAAQLGESLSPDTMNSCPFPKDHSPASNVSTDGTSAVSVSFVSPSSLPPEDSKSPHDEYVSPPEDDSKGKKIESNTALARPMVTVNIEPLEPEVVKQDIVEMYLRSMQQTTDSLAKMKLPMDFENPPESSGKASDDKSPASKNSGSRVFYGSRAFF